MFCEELYTSSSAKETDGLRYLRSSLKMTEENVERVKKIFKDLSAIILREAKDISVNHSVS